MLVVMQSRIVVQEHVLRKDTRYHMHMDQMHPAPCLLMPSVLTHTYRYNPRTANCHDAMLMPAKKAVM